jgi:hypothetical protein
MALIECPECKHAISDRATSCPSCGLPLSSSPLPPQSVAIQELAQPTVVPPSSLPEPQPDSPPSQPESFLFAKIYAGLCFFGCFVAACLAVVAGFQIFQTGDWLNNRTTQRATGQLVAMLLMIALWSVTGISILRRRRRAILLSYVGAAVAVLGILARGIVPLDIILAIPTFLIIPYLRKRSAMLSTTANKALDSARKSTTDEPVVSPPTPPKENIEPTSMKAVGRALDETDRQQQPASPPISDTQSKTTPKASAKTGTRKKPIWPLIVGLVLMGIGSQSMKKPPSGNPYDLIVGLTFGAIGLWVVVNHLITGKKWSKWVSLTLAILLGLGLTGLGYRIQSNSERNKRFGNVLRGFADEAEKSMENGTLPKFNPPGDKTLDVESRVLTDMAQAMISVMGRMNKELEDVYEKDVFDLSVLSNKASLKAEAEKRIESQRIIQKWRPELPRLVFDAMKTKVDSYNHRDKEQIIRGMEEAMINQRPMFETMFNLLEKKETAEQDFLSFMASRDYQIKDGQMIFRSRTATQSEQYNALGQRVEDSYKEIEAFRKQRLDDMKKNAQKFGQ